MDVGEYQDMLNFKKKRHVSFEINEYVLRVLVANNPDLSQAKVMEYPLDQGIIEEGFIRDEMALYDLFKQHLHSWGGKRQNARFFVPDSSIMMRTFDHPSELPANKLKSYVEMELGRTIHLPFSEPLIDVYDHEPNDGQAMLFAAPSEEVQKFMGLLDDVSLHPIVADIRALTNIRFLGGVELFSDSKTYLIADWSIGELSISIYTNGKVEFLRYQSIDLPNRKWTARTIENDEVEYFFDGEVEEYHSQLIDHIAEIDRILNFFQFSIHKGDKKVDEIIVMGDSPELDHIALQLKENYQTPIKMIDDAFVAKRFPGFKGKHATLIGLAMKEEY